MTDKLLKRTKTRKNQSSSFHPSIILPSFPRPHPTLPYIIPGAWAKSRRLRCFLGITRNQIVITRNQLVLMRNQLVLTRNQLVLTKSQLVITRNQLIITRSQLVITRNQLVITRSQLVITRNQLVITRSQLQGGESRGINDRVHGISCR